jgi:hypothetical protein
MRDNLCKYIDEYARFIGVGIFYNETRDPRSAAVTENL